MQSKTHKLLIVEPVAALAQLYLKHLENAGYRADLCADADAACERLRMHDYTLVIADGHVTFQGIQQILSIQNSLSGQNGQSSAVNLLLLAAQNDQTLITKVMKKGAQDFLIKPVNELRLITSVNNLIDQINMQSMLIKFKEESDLTGFHGLIGASVAMQTVYKTIRHVANCDSPVFISGERGTGKSKVASAVHAASARAEKPYLAIDCAKLAQADILDVTLFGGSLDGSAVESGDQSVLRKANEGTVFLNNVDKMPLSVQEKLLAFIRTGKLAGCGFSASEENMSVRFITGSAANIRNLVWRGEFLEDLYGHLAMLPITVPPLRDRGSDVLALAEFFLTHICEEKGMPQVQLTATLVNKINEHHWPGNVTELRHWLRALATDRQGGAKTSLPPFRTMNDDAYIGSNVVSIHIQQATTEEEFSAHTCKLDEFERWIIESRIRAKGGSIPKAAESLGISPSTIYRKRESWCKTVGSVVNE